MHEDKVHKRVYTDPAIFDLEMERIWGKSWIYVGHESQVSEPGQYYSTTLGSQPVILTRHKNGEIYVLFNRCAHKGAQLVGNSSGKVKDFRCGYHAWRFDLDGKCIAIPLVQGYDDTGFSKDDECANVQQVPRFDSYRGFVFASLSKEGPSLEAVSYTHLTLPTTPYV